MAFVRNWRQAPSASGPYVITLDDIPGLNQVFTSAFTDRYRRDGLVGTHVPSLNAAIWRFAIEDAKEGALLWRGERDEIVAFNIVHQSGVEGWMGPLALDPSYQGHGIGKTIVNTGVAWLQEREVSVIGLETMPRTMDNIGFYSTLGFLPGPMTITITIDGAYAANRIPQLSRLPSRDRDDAVRECLALLQSMANGYDFTREIELTAAMNLGDTLLLQRGSQIDGFAICHTVPLVEGRAREEVRVLKLVARTLNDCDTLVTQLADYTRRSAARRVAFRVQGSYPDVYRNLVVRGGRVRWTDLRMTAQGYPEPPPAFGVVLSNWEI